MKRLLIPIIIASVLSACSDDAPEPEIIRPVLSVVVQPKTMQTQGFAGTIEPEYSAGLAFRILGRIVARDVEVGDLVTKGTTIASLDPSTLELGLQAARAELSSAEAQLANASASEERQGALLAQSNTSQAVYDTARQAKDAAQANLDRAKAALTKSEEQLGYAQLFSDFDGVVTAIGAEVGDVVSPGQMVVTVARSDIREAVVDIPDQMIGDIAVGTEFDVILQSSPSIKARGRVREIAPQADGSTRTRRVRLSLIEPQTAFRLGSTVTAMRSMNVEPVIELPISALRTEGENNSVWVFDPGNSTVNLKPVELAAKNRYGFTVASGIEPGARVVTAGVNSLEPGQKVRIMEGAAQ